MSTDPAPTRASVADLRRTVVAAVQLSSQDDLAANLATSARLVAEAAARGARIVVLPENFAFMGEEATRVAAAEPIGARDAPIQSALSALAKKHAVHLVAGGMPERSGDPKPRPARHPWRPDRRGGAGPDVQLSPQDKTRRRLRPPPQPGLTFGRCSGSLIRALFGHPLGGYQSCHSPAGNATS